MTIFILFQTDLVKSKALRIFFGVFDSRAKALDCARYHGLISSYTNVEIKEVSLNHCAEC